MSDLPYWRAGSRRVLGGEIALALAKSRKGLGVRWQVAKQSAVETLYEFCEFPGRENLLEIGSRAGRVSL